MLTRHELAALTERLIDALDSMEPDTDLEPEEDYCLASDDRGSSGPNAHFPGWNKHMELDDDPDCERWHQPAQWALTG